ncbi:flotillin-2-like [Mycetomoellerius zeteki]|uniref:flotillin-2-like n=1 Tax=Mycetomoellerius zeteki TaxID=64791 RepID=UPI00084E59F4|nr:PREDICTED: flotillin-2-like [Trachymyrmex zeteki]
MRKRTIVGGYAFTWWFVTDVQRLSLEVMTLNPVCESVETAQGVPLTVTGVAQCKIMKADELLHTASEQFLGKRVHETVHLRGSPSSYIRKYCCGLKTHLHDAKSTSCWC